MKKLKEYLTNLAKNDYCFNAGDAETFVNTVLDYAEQKGLTSLNEVEIYIDGLLTSLDIETGAID